MAKASGSEPTQQGYSLVCSDPVTEIGSSAEYLQSSGESEKKWKVERQLQMKPNTWDKKKMTYWSNAKWNTEMHWLWSRNKRYTRPGSNIEEKYIGNSSKRLHSIICSNNAKADLQNSRSKLSFKDRPTKRKSKARPFMQLLNGKHTYIPHRMSTLDRMLGI